MAKRVSTLTRGGKRDTQPQPGTVSHGTMRNVDLIPAFLCVLQECNSPAWEQLQMQPHPLPPSYALEDPQSDWWNSEQADYFVHELFGALDDCAPDGHYFGAHPGDGSDFGFWPSEEYEGNGRMPEFWFRAGSIERGAKYAWKDGYARVTSRGVEHPWLTKREAQSAASSRGAKAVFFDTREEAEAAMGMAPNAAPPPPPRRGKLDPTRRLARVTAEHARREKPFDPEAPRERYAKPHHFAVNVRGGGVSNPLWSPGEELWRRRELILPTEADQDSPFPLDGGVVGALYEWHGGQSSMVYSLASTGAHDLVSRSMIRAAIDELQPDLLRSSGKDRKHLEALIADLEMILDYPEGASASEAGMDIEEYDYDTWTDNYDPGLSKNASRRERTHAALAGHPDPEIDEHAANELELYLDNDRRFAPGSPTGQGRAIANNMLRKIKKGVYDHTLAVQGWMHVVESAAKTYTKEFESSLPWNKMFNVATRRAVAQSLADRFKREVEGGEWD